MSAFLFRNAAGILGAALLISKPLESSEFERVSRETERQPVIRAWRKPKPANPFKKASRKRQKKARAINRRHK